MGIYIKGCYVKITVSNFAYKHFRKLEPETPVVICRINPSEDNMGFLKVRLKKHMWYTNILKTGDPLIFSIGWRRFQSIPTFIREDQNDRVKMIKYTPEYDFCEAVLYSSFMP